jgi:DNA invertase Pin-like site-specific DNA recombinase
MSNSPITGKDETVPVAQYVRMSTDQQQYSIDNQTERIRRYTRDHKMEIVETYTGAAKSGLTLQNRPGLNELLKDVEGGKPGNSAILV